MYTLYIANKNYSSWSLRPWILMQVLGISFHERLEPFDGPEHRAGFKSFSPTGKVPCLIDGERQIWDSLSITEYLAERHPMVWPTNDDARAWARSAAAEMHSSFQALRSLCPMNVGVRINADFASQVLQKDIARINEIWSQGLQKFGGPFLAGGAFSAVDAFYSAVVFRWQTYEFALSQSAEAYARTVLALPAMQAWQRSALSEKWREESHEADTRAAGRITSDLRAQSI